MQVQQAEVKKARSGAYAEYRAPKAYAQHTPAYPDPLYTSSGALVLDLPEIRPGDRFPPFAVALTGLPFQGRLRHFAGVSVRESPQVLDASGQWADAAGNKRGFILDFGGMRSMLRLLNAPGTSFKYTCVLPWMGADFGPSSLYPSHPASPPDRSPDASGASKVSLRGAESQKLYVQIEAALSAEAFQDACVLETLVFPSNLRASVGGKPPFWTFPGTLQGDASMTGLAEALTALATDLDAPMAPKLAIQSDTPGVLAGPADFAFPAAEKSAAGTWAGSPSTGAQLRAGVPGTLPVHFVDGGDGHAWELRSLRLEAAADLSPWIFEAATAEPAGRAALRVDARLSAAQAFASGPGIRLYGMGLNLAASAESEIALELRPDDGGRPAAGDPLATRMLTVSGAAAWYEALFEAPLELEAGAIYWLAAKSKSGSVLWSAAAAEDPSGAACYAEEGTAWQPFPRMLPGSAGAACPAAALRLLRAPRPEENQARVVVSHTQGASEVEMPLPVSAEAGTVEWLWPEDGRPVLLPGGDGRTLTLELKSLASGTLSIASAALFFAWKDT